MSSPQPPDTVPIRMPVDPAGWLARELCLKAIRSALRGDLPRALRDTWRAARLAPTDPCVVALSDLLSSQKPATSVIDAARTAVHSLQLSPPNLREASLAISEAGGKGLPPVVVAALNATVAALGCETIPEQPTPLRRDGWGHRLLWGVTGLVIGVLATGALIESRVPSPSDGVVIPIAPAGILPNATSDSSRRWELTAAFSSSDHDILRLVASGIPSDWPMRLREEVRNKAVGAGRRAYRASGRLLSSGRPDSAGTILEGALPALAGTWLEDDALYRIALSRTAAGDRDQARRYAARLLDSFPNSLFANSQMRSLSSRQP